MRITPLDIYQQEFKRVLRGVDPDEVEDFLERVADDYESLIKENAALKEQIASLSMSEKTKQPDAPKATTEKNANGAIREAKKEADSLIREARKEAGNIVRKAQNEASELRSKVVPDENAHEEAAAKADEFAEKVKANELELRREISRLLAKKERFLIEYRELLEKHLEFLTEET